MSKRSRVLAAGLAAAVLVTVLAVPSSLEAASITIYTAPDRTYQNTINSPCIFYGTGPSATGNCPQDPIDWPAPVGPTNQDVPQTLTQTYSGTAFTTFDNLVGVNDSFVLGLDINQDSNTQEIDPFSMTFYGSAGALLSVTLAPPPLAVPAIANGRGYADYIIAAGCAGTTTELGAIDACSQYAPFVIPAGATSVTFTFGFDGSGNDGADKLFLIPTTGTIPPPDPAPVPEPGSLVLLGSGLALAARSLRRQRRAAQKPAPQLSDLQVLPEPQALPRLRKPRGTRLAETQPQTKH